VAPTFDALDPDAPDFAPPLRSQRAPLARATRAVLATVVLALLGVVGVSRATASAAPAARPRPTIVLVHGSFADASGFDAVIQRLHRLGYTTIAPANPLRGLDSDAASIRSVLQTISGPVVLVAHSYGGMVITNAATGLPNVKALVYVNGFAPAQGESVNDLAYKFPGSMLTPENLTVRPHPASGPAETGLEAYINADVFREAFAADVDRQTTAVMAATQRPIDLAALQQPSGPPAWATIPSWFVIGRDDHTIPFELHRFMAARAGAVRTVELWASHALMVSKPNAVTDVIVEAAQHR
jgi:pimeloyl-ACP methyl ester carboxylesterase